MSGFQRLFRSPQILLQISTEHDSHTVRFCAKFQNGSRTIIRVMIDEILRDFILWRISVGFFLLLLVPRLDRVYPTWLCQRQAISLMFCIVQPGVMPSFHTVAKASRITALFHTLGQNHQGNQWAYSMIPRPSIAQRLVMSRYVTL